jgi:mono/diheme cytochrome c family protein
MSVRSLLTVFLLASAGVLACRNRVEVAPADSMLDAIRAEEKARGLTYAEGQGKHLFDHYCVSCHGDGGQGDGENASNLTPPPPDLTTSKSAADASYVRRVIAEGSAAVGRSPLSPPWGRSLSAQEIDYLVLYLQALQTKARTAATTP